jgi:hypothetical protein
VEIGVIKMMKNKKAKEELEKPCSTKTSTPS